MKKVNQAHDKFFKSVFSVKENAVDFLQESLPLPLKENINLTQIKMEPDSYIEGDLKTYFSDIVYSGYYQENKVKISFLFEHKSYQDPHIRIQLNQYILNAWNHALKQKEELPVVLPIIVYHGKRKWRMRPITSYFKNMDNNLLPYIPNFDYLVCDLSAYSNEQIINLYSRLSLQATLLMLKNSYNQELLIQTLENFLKIGYIYDQEDKGILFLRNVLTYIFSLKEKDPEYRKKIEEIFSKQGVDAMTILEDIQLQSEKKGEKIGIEKGEKIGIKKGEIEKGQNTLIRLIDKKYKITKQEIALIRSITDVKKLDNALDELFASGSKKSVLAHLK